VPGPPQSDTAGSRSDPFLFVLFHTNGQPTPVTPHGKRRAALAPFSPLQIFPFPNWSPGGPSRFHNTQTKERPRILPTLQAEQGQDEEEGHEEGDEEERESAGAGRSDDGPEDGAQDGEADHEAPASVPVRNGDGGVVLEAVILQEDVVVEGLPVPDEEQVTGTHDGRRGLFPTDRPLLPFPVLDEPTLDGLDVDGGIEPETEGLTVLRADRREKKCGNNY